jgi:hypothetical protein
MGLAEDDDVIEAFPADRADQPFRMSVLPRRPWGCRVISDAHRRKTLRDHLTVGCVAISNQIVRCFILREGLGGLAGDPHGRGQPQVPQLAFQCWRLSLGIREMLAYEGLGIVGCLQLSRQRLNDSLQRGNRGHQDRGGL